MSRRSGATFWSLSARRRPGRTETAKVETNQRRVVFSKRHRGKRSQTMRAYVLVITIVRAMMDGYVALLRKRPVSLVALRDLTSTRPPDVSMA